MRFLYSFLLIKIAFTTGLLAQGGTHNGKTGMEWAEVMQNSADEEDKVRAARYLGYMGVRAENAVDTMIKFLRDRNPRVREAMAEGLGKMEKSQAKTVPALKQLIRDTDPNVVLAVKLALVRQGAEMEDAIGILGEFLKTSTNSNMLVSAVEELVKRAENDPRALRALAKAAENKNSYVVNTTARLVRPMGTKAESLISSFLTGYSNTRGTSGREIIPTLEALDTSPKRAITLFQNMLKMEDQYARQAGLMGMAAYAGHTRTGVSAVQSSIKSEDVNMQRAVIAGLALSVKPVPAFIPLLRAELRREDRSTLNDVLLALGKMGEAAKVAVPGIVKYIQPDSSYRSTAFNALAEIGPGSLYALPQLREILKADGYAYDKQQAAMVIGRIGPSAKEAIPDLIRLLDDSYVTVRGEAMVALARMGEDAKSVIPKIHSFTASELTIDVKKSQEALEIFKEKLGDKFPELTEIAKSEPAQVRNAEERPGDLRTAKTEPMPQVKEIRHEGSQRVGADIHEESGPLAEVGLSAASSTDELAGALTHESAEIRSAVARALGSKGREAEGLVSPLANLLKDEDKGVQSSAAWALGSLGGNAGEALPQLEDLVKSAPVEIRRSAAWALGAMGTNTQSSVEVLTSALGSDDAMLQWTAAWSLGRIGAAAKTALPALTSLSNSENELAKAAAKEALELIHGK